jgi:putative ABC transport system permease protein
MKTSAWVQMARMAWQYLKGRKLRTTLTTLAIVFGVALIFAMNLALPGAEKAFQQSMEAESKGVDLSVSSLTGEAFAPQGPTALLAQTDGVEAVTGVLRRRIILPKTQQFGDITQIELVGVDLATVSAVHKYDLRDGRFIETDGEAVVAPDIAKTGETITVVTAAGLKPYTVVGVLKDGGFTPRVLVTLVDAQTALNDPGLVNLLEVGFTPGVNKDKLTAQIKKTLGDQYLYNATADDQFAAMKVAYMIFSLFGVIALFLGGFLIYNTFRTVVIERRRDLAMLRAIGATRRQITQMILIESLLQGLVGALIGLIVGYLMVAGMTALVDVAWEQFAAQLNFSVVVTPRAFVVPVGLGVFFTLIAGYWPAQRAGRTSPLEALRPSSGSDVQRAARWGLVLGMSLMGIAVLMLLGSAKTTIAGAVLFLVGTVIAGPGLVVPAARLFNPLLTLWFAREGDLARGNMVRQPGRAAITASTLMIGLATFILVAAVVTGFKGLTKRLVDKSFSSDILVMPTTIGAYSSIVGADENTVDELRALPDVEQVADLRHAASSYNGQRLEVYGIDPQVYPLVSPMLFTEGESAQAYTKLETGRTAILNPVAALLLGVGVGDTFEMPTLEGKQPYQIVGIASDLLNFKLATIFISQDSLKADFNKTETILMMVNIKPGADTQTVADEIKQVLRDYPQFDVEVTSDYRATLENLMSAGMNAFYFLGILIMIPAALGLLNTLTINVLERTREIGIVRAVGGSRTQVRRIVIAEALLLCLFGAAVGVLAGVMLSYGFTMAFSLIGWELDYVFPVMGVIAAIVIAILLALFSSILPARNAARLDIIRALQYE